MPVEATRTITVRIRNIDHVIDLTARLTALCQEMEMINVRNTPIHHNTKERWREEISEARDFLQQFIPKP